MTTVPTRRARANESVAMPGHIAPMLASAGPLPRDDDPAWSYEMKWDGYRVVVHVDGDRVRVDSRNLLDATALYPELGGLGAALGGRRRLVLDGEVVALDAQGRPSFSALQTRAKVGRHGAVTPRAGGQVPVVLYAFDLLWLDGVDLMRKRQDERRAALLDLGLDGPSWQVPPAFDGPASAVQQASLQQGLEGLMAKRLDASYHPGRRAEGWRKVKNIRRQELVVAGWTPGGGGRSGRIGSLLLGYYDDEKTLRYAGSVGTGFTSRVLTELAELLAPMAREASPFSEKLPYPYDRTSRFVEPTLVCEVEYTEWTHEGKIRHPSYKGLRYDKDARDVGREP